MAEGRTVGRPRKKWLEDAENNLQELKVNRCWQKINNIEERTSFAEEAKALTGSKIL
jgi:hypothetical protein